MTETDEPSHRAPKDAREDGPRGGAPRTTAAPLTRARRPRAPELDHARGIAVCIMVAWHLSDGWLALVHRDGLAWSSMRAFGGLAAPLFIFVTGASVGLGAKSGRSLGRAARRGVMLVVLGFLLRLQSWAIDRNALLHPHLWPALVAGLVAAACALLWLTSEAERTPAEPLAAPRAPRESQRSAPRDRSEHAGVAIVASAPRAIARAVRDARRAIATSRALRACIGAVAVVAFGACLLGANDASPRLLVVLLRFDVLHCIGAAGVVCALVASTLTARGAWRASAWLGAGALVLVAAAPLVVDAAHGLGWSDALAWLARDRTQRSLAPFPVLPWTAYAFAGCALTLAPIDRSRPERALVHALIAIVLAALVFEGGLEATRDVLALVPSLRPFARFAFHTAVSFAIVSACAALRWKPLVALVAALGRSSLPIYWFHLELAYGAMARPIKHALTPAQCALGVLAVVAIACVASLVRARGRGGERAHTLAQSVVSASNLRA